MTLTQINDQVHMVTGTTVTHGTHLVVLTRDGAEFENGELVERPAESGADAQIA
ncbi:MAG: hypothetical protein ACRDQF_18665 [Thermocrispum sp.]